MKKKKQIIEVTGKIDGKEKIEKEPTMLEQIWGFNELAKYGTNNEEEYSKKLNEMTRTDLETHARKVGVVILESTDRLKESLKKEFRSYYIYLYKPKTVIKPLDKKAEEEVKRILRT